MAVVILAVDLAKAKSLFCWFDTADQSHRFKTVPSTPATFHEALLEQPVDRVVIEVCDMAGWVKDLCEALSIPIQVANVNVEGWRWKNVKNKTDKTDVLKLARLSMMNDLKTVWLPDRTTRRAMKAGKEAWTEQSLANLWKLAKPIGECSKDALWSGHLWMELKNLDHLMEQIEALDRKLDGLGDADHRVIRLKTIPGVGPRLSELVVAVIDDPKRFKNARQVGAYAGLVPRRYQSGQMDRVGRISKAGCGKLRKLLVEIAWGMLQHNTHGQNVFGRISKGQKTRRKQAAVALARRVLVWCWAMLRDGSDWRDPTSRPAIGAIGAT